MLARYYNSGMNDEQLLQSAPSIFTTEPSDRMSEEYVPVSTIDVVNSLRDSGYYPVQAFQTQSRKPDRRVFAKHLIRFRHRDQLGIDTRPYMYDRTNEPIIGEAVLTNSHDGTSKWEIDSGVYSIVCSNGMIRKTADFGGMSVKHKGSDVLDRVVDGVNAVSDMLAKIVSKVELWRSLELSREQEDELAKRVLRVRYPELSQAPVYSHALSYARRDTDYKRDLWTIFNKMQENVMVGGLSSGLQGEHRRRTTRPIRSVAETLRFNKEAWQVVEDYEAELI